MTEADLIPARLSWNETEIPGVGTIPAVNLTVPVDMEGRIDVWKIPPCDKYPEGLFVSNNTAAYYQSSVPGCESWLATKLCSVRFCKLANLLEDDTEMSNDLTNRIEFCHSAISIHAGVLNPTQPESEKEGE